MGGDRRGWVFLDLDGTLIDTLPALYRAYRSLLAEYGRRGSRAEFDRLNGPTLRQISQYLKRKYALGDSVDRILERYEAQVCRAYRKVGPAVKRLPVWVRGLRRQGWSVALVTSSPRRLAQDLIRRQGWSGCFEVCVFGDDVRRSKPDPEIYQRAIRLTGADPTRSVAVEDSPGGSCAAARAGLVVLKAGWARGVRPQAVEWSLPRAEDLMQLRPQDVPMLRGEFSVRPVHSVRISAAARLPRSKRGHILMVDGYVRRLGPVVLRGSYRPYERYLALARLTKDRGVRALAVTAVVWASGAQGPRVLLGLRGAGVSTYRRRWEISPAGGVDPSARRAGGRVDLKAAILSELREEAGYGRKDVRAMRVFALAEDTRLRTLDVCFEIELDASAAARGPELEPSEHDRMVWMDARRALRILRDEERSVPTCAPVLRGFLASLEQDNRGVR